jgi:hypothetical protein
MPSWPPKTTLLFFSLSYNNFRNEQNSPIFHKGGTTEESQKLSKKRKKKRGKRKKKTLDYPSNFSSSNAC